MENETLKKLKRFVLSNKKIKEALRINAPASPIQPYDAESIIKYVDKLPQNLEYIFSLLKSIALDFGSDLFLNKIIEIENQTMKALISCKQDIKKLRTFYEQYLTFMSDELKDSVKRECVGDTFNIPLNSVKLSKTVNEILHVMHFYIMNNANIYRSTNQIAQKYNVDDHPITLYGADDPFAKNLFDSFPLELDCGFVEIVSIENNRIMMMVRDKGHALTIEIEKNNDKIWVDYFIPKLCNIEMINKLPGVRKVKEDADMFSGTVGLFLTSEENFYEKLYSFIDMVPTDKDIIPFSTGPVSM